MDYQDYINSEVAIDTNPFTSIVSEYYGTNDQSEIPDSNTIWSEEYPQFFIYKWTRTVTTYSDNSQDFSDPVLLDDRDVTINDNYMEEYEPVEEIGQEIGPILDDQLDLNGEPQEAEEYTENEQWLTQTEAFNALTNNGTANGIYMQEDGNGVNQLYINMTYARSGVLQVGGSENKLGVFQVLDENNQDIGHWDKQGIMLNGGVIQSKDNKSWWNLSTGTLNLNGYITSYKTEYAVGSSMTEAPTQGWSQTAPTQVPDGQYIWQRSTLKRTGDADQVKTVCLSGKNGTDGRGIRSANTQYYLSTSNERLEGGSWSDAAPSYVKNRYYWTRTKTIYTDSVTEYSDSVLDMGLTDANRIAADANTAASAAQTAATTAETNAAEAIRQAGLATTAAATAQSSADDAATAASNAQTSADAAATAASTADAKAVAAGQAASAADAKAVAAQTAADNAQSSADDAATAASNAQTSADNAASAAQTADQKATAAGTAAATADSKAVQAAAAAQTADDKAVAAASAASQAQTSADNAQSSADAAAQAASRANSTANGAVTSLGILQGVVDNLGDDVDDLQTHVAMMDAITDENGKVIVPSGLHVVPTSNGYFVVISNDGMYVYDPQSVLVATFGENINFNSYRPQRIGGENAYIEYYDSNNDGKADALRIIGAKVDITGGTKIQSNNYQASQNASSPYSATGTFLDLSNGRLYMPNFGVDADGKAYINGEIIATSGKIGEDSTSYWEIGTQTDYNNDDSAALIGHGTSFIQTGDFQLSNGLLNTRSYTANHQITYPKYNNTYWDFGVQAPTLDTSTSGYVAGIDDNFFYIRNHESTIPALKTDWNYLYRVDKNGNIYTTGQIYINGQSLDQLYASISDVDSSFLPTTGGTISGNLTVTGSINGTATKATQLTHTLSINNKTWDGSANTDVGTIGVAYGGTGGTTFTSGAALIGNGQGAFQTRAITNNTSANYISGSTNLITANTLKFWNGAYDSSHTSNLEYVKQGKLGTVVTHDLEDFITAEGGIIDGSLSVTDLNAGSLVVTGAARFTNAIYGDLTGNADTADKVNHDLIIKLNSGTTEGTNMFTFDGSAAKTVNVTPAAIGLGNVNNTADSTKNVLTATKFSSARTINLTGDTIGSASNDGSAGWSIATQTKYLRNNGRIASADIQTADNQNSRMTLSLASGSMTTNKPPTGDGNILTFGWDNNGWASQLAIGHTKTPHLAIRGAAGATIDDVANRSDWGNWQTVLDSNNYTNYTVTKTGSGASGTWGINISGNAATATTATTADSAGSATNATKDASGNVITDTYLKKSGDTMTGNLTFSKPTTAGEKRGFIFSGVTDSAALYYLEPNLQDDGRMRFVMKDNNTDPIEMAWTLYRSAGNEIPGEHVVHSFNALGYTLTPIQEADGTYNVLSISPGINDKGTIGTSSYKWNAMYATTFYGALSGNATSAGKINATRAFTIGKTTKNVDWSGAVSFSQAEVSDVASNTANGWMSKEDKAKLDSITVSDIGTVGANSIVGEKDIKVTISQGVATIGHANTAVTAGTASGTATSTLTNGGSFNIPSVTFDAYGHITAKGTTTLTLPNITSITGNAATATKFNSNRTVALTGDVTGSASGDGSSGWSIATTVGNDSHNHTLGTIVPILSKTYTGIIGTANTFADGSFYYGKIVPDDYYSTWKIKYRIHTYVPNKDGYDMKADVMVSGHQSNLASYSSMNTVAQYYPAYYHELYRATKAGVENGYGHALGIRLASSYNPTAAGYERTVVIEIMKTENCTFTFFDNMMKYAAIPGTGSTNYSGYTEMNYVSNGLQETGDSDTLDDRQTYFVGKTGSQGIWAGSLFMQVNNGTYENICTASDGTATNSNRTTATTKKANTVGFKVGGKVYYSNSNYNANTNISGWAAVYNQCNAVDSRYAFNTELVANSLTPYAPIYLVGSIASDGLFYLDTVWWTQTPNTTGKIYILVGGCFDSTTSNCRFSLYQHNPWYIYDGTKLVDYSAYAIISDVYAKKSGTTFTGAVNFNNATWNKMGDDCYIGDNNTGGCICIKGINAATGINFVPYSGSTSQKISIDGAGTMTVTGTLAGTFSGNLSGTATKATQDGSGNTITSTYVNVDGSNKMTGNLIIRKAGTGANNWASRTDNPSLIFETTDNQSAGFVFTQYDSVQAPSSVTLVGNADGVYFIAPNIKATGKFYGDLSGNATSATKATQDSDGLIIKDTYAKKASPTFTGSVTSPYYLATTKMTVSAGKVYESVTTSLPRGGLFADGIAFNSPGTYNDAGWIRILGTGESDTVLEIATGDDGGQTNGTAETIVARQYSASNAIRKELTILDKLGNTEIPGTLTIADGVTLVWNATTKSLDFTFVA